MVVGLEGDLFTKIENFNVFDSGKLFFNLIYGFPKNYIVWWTKNITFKMCYYIFAILHKSNKNCSFSLLLISDNF